MSTIPTISSLLLGDSQRKQIESEGARAYPDECCGIIYGRDKSVAGAVQRIVEQLEPVHNAFDNQERYHRFSITPQALMKAERDAAAAGRLVLGFYHSHPDHPARPSEYDRQHAWPYYSYIIVSIENGKPAQMTSWLLDEQTEQFRSQPIERTEGDRP